MAWVFFSNNPLAIIALAMENLGILGGCCVLLAFLILGVSLILAIKVHKNEAQMP